jgi:hypothetical protein
MHRSGTSLVAKSLAMTGLNFGVSHIPVQTEINRDGFFEDEKVVAINEAILQRNNLFWWSLETLVDHFSEKTQSEIKSYLLSVDSEVYAIKDPRLCLTIGAWIEAANDAGIEVNIIWVSRTIKSIALSLYKRDLLPMEISYELSRHYHNQFYSVAKGCENFFGVIEYPPKPDQLDSLVRLNSWLKSVGCKSFKSIYLSSYQDSENKNYSDTSILTMADKKKLLDRWQLVHGLIGSLEDLIIDKRDEWIKSKLNIVLKKDEVWHVVLEKRIDCLERKVGESQIIIDNFQQESFPHFMKRWIGRQYQRLRSR